MSELAREARCFGPDGLIAAWADALHFRSQQATQLTLLLVVGSATRATAARYGGPCWHGARWETYLLSSESCSKQLDCRQVNLKGQPFRSPSGRPRRMSWSHAP